MHTTLTYIYIYIYIYHIAECECVCGCGAPAPLQVSYMSLCPFITHKSVCNSVHACARFYVSERVSVCMYIRAREYVLCVCVTDFAYG
jgi:hypothetical protein